MIDLTIDLMSDLMRDRSNASCRCCLNLCCLVLRSLQPLRNFLSNLSRCWAATISCRNSRSRDFVPNILLRTRAKRSRPQALR